MPLRPATLLLVVLLAWAAPAPAAESAREILRRVGAATSEIGDLKAALSIRLTTLGLCMPLEGKIYFKRPDRFKLDIKGMPRFLRDRKSAFSSVVPTHLTSDRYKVVSCERTSLGGRSCWRLTLSPLEKSDRLELLHMWVDCSNYSTPAIIGRYRDGSVVETSTAFSRVGKYLLPSRQKIKFKFPSFRCEAFIDYSKYSINSGLPDSLFK